MNLDDQLAELWAAGASFTDMGLKLGESRNVIAGRIDRARRAGDPRFRSPTHKPEPYSDGGEFDEGEVVGVVFFIASPLLGKCLSLWKKPSTRVRKR